jgi:hypothetical protein
LYYLKGIPPKDRENRLVSLASGVNPGKIAGLRRWAGATTFGTTTLYTTTKSVALTIESI